MLKPQEAEERLKAQRCDGRTHRVQRAAALPESLRLIVLALHGLDAPGKTMKDRGVYERVQAEAWKQLHEQSDAERESLFECLFPNIGAHVERAWQLFPRLPYQSGYFRKAFRAPTASAPLRAARQHWLHSLMTRTLDFEYDIVWFAAWTPYLGYGADILGILFAAAIDAGGPEGEAVYETLLASARGEHAIGAMGRHVTRALLVASRPDGWEFVEKLLLAAQRQEGLRQVILETVDEAHPEAFRRMLRLMLEHDLMRFSSALRAVAVWIGVESEAFTLKQWNTVVAQVLCCLENPEARDEPLNGEGAARRFCALWTIAFEDAYAAIAPAARMLEEVNAEYRLAAVRFLGLLCLPEAKRALLPALDDAELPVATTAFSFFRYGRQNTFAASDLFERLERLLARVPKEQQAQVAGSLTHCLGDRSPKRLLPHMSRMDPWHRRNAISALSEGKPWDAETRETLFALIGDPSPDVREEVLNIIARCEVTEPEIRQMERLLTRKAGDLRRGVLTLLLKQNNTQALAGAERLLASKEPLQRLAGLELLHEMSQRERSVERCRAMAETYRQQRPRRTEAEDRQLAAFLEPEREVPTLENGLGLFDPAQRTPPTPPRDLENTSLLARLGDDLALRLTSKTDADGEASDVFRTKAAVALLRSLDALIHTHRETPITLENWNGGQREELLGNVQWGFPQPNPKTPLQDDLAHLPLREVWECWWQERPTSLCDGDGMELLRALAATEHTKTGANRYPGILPPLLSRLLRLSPPSGGVDFLLDAVETSFAKVPKDVLELQPHPNSYYHGGWRNRTRHVRWLEIARQHRDFHPTHWTDAHHVRLWGLLRWMDEPGTQVPRYRPPIEEVVAAYRAGGATEADLLDHLIGPRDEHRHYGQNFDSLLALSGRKPSPLFAACPILKTLVERCRERILDVELQRGEMPTAASVPALALRWTGGADTLLRLLTVFGRGSLVRNTGYSSDNKSKALVFSELIRGTFPTEQDTPDAFASGAQAAGIAPQRLIEVAVYAPRWARHCEQALSWKGFAEGVWWLHAHTKDAQWSVSQEIRDIWAAEISDRTPLSAESLLEGAVDVAWFQRAYKLLGPERWTELDGAARYASSGSGHKRAQLFADAMLGRLTSETLCERIRETRNQDAVRALGLVPLPKGKARDRELLERYEMLQEFLRTSRQFGSMRQASEKRAAQIGMENLARTAGCPDPARLEWAMEAAAVADLAHGPVVVTAGEVAVSLAINAWGKPELTVARNGKPLKAIPAALKKEAAIVALQERKREIERQAARMRRSLEEAMCRGDQFTGAELQDLMAHPALTPMLRSLVFIGEDVAGYPVEQGRALESYDGSVAPVARTAQLAIAHP